jgi:dephospho-CoA kinase
MFKVGITGGVGCGKSTAARFFEAKGFSRIDSDALVRDRVLRSEAVVAALRSRHGPGIFGSGGELDRAALAQRVFADDTERVWLEDLVHPQVFAIWRDEFAAGPAKRWIVEVPLLFEKGLENWFDFTICVALAPEEQLARLEQRGLSRELAGQRISKQLPLARKIELSDYVLWNQGAPEFLQAQVDRLALALSAA